MAGKLELNAEAKKLKEAGVKERACLDWDKTGIEYFNGEKVSTFKPKKEVKK